MQLPPGPKENPLLGNVRHLPTTNEGPEHAKLGKTYGAFSSSSTLVDLIFFIGPVVHFRILYRHLVVVNTFEAANDLLDKRGAIYSDRPRFPMLNEL